MVENVVIFNLFILLGRNELFVSIHQLNASLYELQFKVVCVS